MHDENRKMYRCDKCGKDFTPNSFLKCHIKLHEFSDDQVVTHSTLPSLAKTVKNNYSYEAKTEIKYTCDQCNHDTKTKSNLKRHQQSVHERLRY